KAFVFVETSGNVRKRYVGWAEPQKIRWAFANKFPWLEQGYAEAYSTILSQGKAFVVTNDGKLGYQHSTRDPRPSIELLKEFLQRVQTPIVPPPGDSENWVPLETTTVPPSPPTYEHASWIDSEKLEQLLGSDLNTSTIKSAELRSKNSM